MKEEMRSVLREVVRASGAQILGREEMEFPRSLDVDGYRIRLGMPQMMVAVELGHELLESNPEYAVDELHRGVGKLFSTVIDHIAKHDRSPIDRMQQIEAAARYLCDALIGNPTDGVPTMERVLRLRQLLDAKPGSPSWGRGGYGQ